MLLVLVLLPLLLLATTADTAAAYYYDCYYRHHYRNFRLLIKLLVCFPEITSGSGGSLKVSERRIFVTAGVRCPSCLPLNSVTKGTI